MTQATSAGTYASGSGPHPHRVPFGDRWARLTSRQRVVAFVAALVAVVVIVQVIGSLRKPPPAPPPCATSPCPPPERPGGVGDTGIVVHPAAGSTAPRLRLDGVWTFPLGVSLEYDKDIWLEPGADNQGADWVTLRSKTTTASGNQAYSLFIQVLPAIGNDPTTTKATRIDYFRAGFPDILDEPEPKRQVLGVPMVGARPAVASLLVGTFNGTTPTRMTFAVVAASDQAVTVVMSMVAEDAFRASAMSATDSVMGAVAWP
jgi:hypothetical protein